MKSLRLVPGAIALSVVVLLSTGAVAVGLPTGARPPVSDDRVALAAGRRADAQWPSFRGPRAAGVSEATGLPSAWDLATGANVRWTLDLPGVSHSSPVVWEDRIYLISAISANEADAGRVAGVGNTPVEDSGPFDWRLYAIDRTSGAEIWSVSAHEGRPRTDRHEKSSPSNSTPATDGRHVVAIFASEGMFCYDLDGNLLWQVDLGLLDTGLYGDRTSQWGYAASPTIHGDRVFVQVDRHTDSFIAAYRLADGAEIWRTPRREKNTWSTPTIVEHAGGELLVANGGNYIRGYDPANGEELWRFADDAEVKVPTPFAAGGKIIVAGGYPQGRPVYAIDPGARGDVSGADSQALAWRVPRGGPYTATPVAVEELVFSVADNGVLSAWRLDTGESVYRERLDGTFSASPVAADGKLYLASEQGVVYTVAVGPTFELLASNDMGEPMFATPALVDGMVVLRGRDRLFGIGG